LWYEPPCGGPISETLPIGEDAATGTWQLPPTPYNEPAFGKRYLPGDMAPAK
jgi:hypothetical protein